MFGITAVMSSSPLRIIVFLAEKVLTLKFMPKQAKN
jgi:hypothetical protein